MAKLFRMHKFRTMVVNADRMVSAVAQKDENGNAIHKTRYDPRVTRLGSFLRRFSLDELPQFINVLSGEMSLVGPRPELPRLVNEYQHWQRQRMAVPPGMTGWWQVNGRSERMMHLHVEDDLYYVNHYSIWLDLLDHAENWLGDHQREGGVLMTLNSKIKNLSLFWKF